MKALNIFLGILFISFAVLQLNDPDPLLWVLLYGLVALVSFMAVFGKYQKILISLGLLACIIWMITLIPGVVDWIQKGMPSITGEMKATSPHIEFTREFLGLLIAGVVLLYHFRISNHSKK